jgi:hypothetical protein
MVDGHSLTLTLALAADDDRISGRLRDERGDEHGFSSWLGLVSLLEAVRARTAPQSGTETRVRVAYEPEE